MSTAHKIAIVGAGPGCVDLLTVRAFHLLKSASAVLYDRLIDQSIIDLLPADCKLVPVGKSPGKSGITQEEINELLVAYAESQPGVVRLKSGDPFVLARGAEEAQYLKKRGVPFEIVPGISSAIAAPGGCCIPVTHRGISQAFVVVTGHEAHEQNAEFDWSAVVRIDTIVILMGVRRRQFIARKLIEHGRAETERIVFIENASLPTERVVHAILGEVAEKPPEVSSPAVTVIGPVVALHDILRDAGAA